MRLTRRAHQSGTDRLAEVARDARLRRRRQRAGRRAAARPGDDRRGGRAVRDRPVADDEHAAPPHRRSPPSCSNPNVIKVVVDRDGFALYFSRAPIPYTRARAARAAGLRAHIGLYVYRRDVPARLAALPPTPLERAEALEQLRALEHGIRIKAVETTYDSIGVDTPEDLERVRALCLRGAGPSCTHARPGEH